MHVIVSTNLKITDYEKDLFGNPIKSDVKNKEKKIIKALIKTFNGKILNFNERKIYNVNGVFNN